MNDYTLAFDLKPDNIALLDYRAKAYIRLHRFEHAVSDLNCAIERNPNQATYFVHRGEAMHWLGYFERALSDFDRALALDKDQFRDICLNKGLVLSYLQQYPESLEVYQEGLRLFDSDIDGYYTSLVYNIAVVQSRWKGHRNAKMEIDRARNTLHSHAESSEGSANYGLGGLAALAGDDELALHYLKSAVQLLDAAVVWAKYDIAWDNLRNDSRFQSLITESSRVKLADNPNALSC